MNTMQERRTDEGTENKNRAALWPDWAGTMIVCFSGAKDGVPAGKLWSFYFEQPRPFRGLDGLLFAMDAVMDEAGKPSPWCERRSLLTKPKRRGAAGRQPYVPPPQPQDPFYGPDALAGRRGRLCTAAVRVYQRQNASMQGELRVPGHESICFRSALELLHLLREALELSGAKGACG